MRDGVELIADHYEPHTLKSGGHAAGPRPLWPGCPFSVLFADVYASRGYHVVVQSVRGTFGSGGEFSPMVHEIADGADTAAWLRDQPWFTGSFATIGMSYLGFTQWALLTDPPPEMKAAVITVGPHDLSGPRWGTGSFGLNDFLGWSDMVAHQEDPGRHPRHRAPGSGATGGGPSDKRAARRRGGPGTARRRARRGTSPGSSIPSTTTRSGLRCSCIRRWSAHRFRCCCSAAGRICSSSRRWRSTDVCASARCRSPSPSDRGPTRR